jgi:hypothetical protein
VTSAFSSETNIDFQPVNVTANSVGPSLQMIVERKTRLEFDPYKFEELCFESNEVIKKTKDASLRLVEGSGILHEEPLLQPGKYRTCILNNIKGELTYTSK